MTAGKFLQFVYIVSNGDRAIFADILGITVAQVEAWIDLGQDDEIPDSEWLDDYAEMWKREEKEARLLARLTGKKFEVNRLGMPERMRKQFEALDRKYAKKD